jgi:predicted TIM-barrel fold metal-dependent hydrolase
MRTIASTTPAAEPKSGFFGNARHDWLALHVEETLEPERRVVDAHHHLWARPGRPRYLIEEYATDIADSGHDIVATVYVECHSMYRQRGPAELQSVGEIEFANGVAAMSESGGYGGAAICAAIVGHADLRLGARVRAVLEAQISAGNGRFRGIRHLTAWDEEAEVAGPLAGHPSHLHADPQFREGFACLEPLGLTFDAMIFQPQLFELRDLARAFPGTTIVVNHCGGPLAVGRFAGHRDEAFAEWRDGIRALGAEPNVMIKLGGLATRLLGTEFEDRPLPPSSQEAAAAWAPYVETCVESFGPQRCMAESNFPPDKGQCSYQVAFNALKRIAAQYTEAEQEALFAGTAAQTYRLALQA